MTDHLDRGPIDQWESDDGPSREPSGDAFGDVFGDVFGERAGLDLEEPSGLTDETVLAAARRSLRGRDGFGRDGFGRDGFGRDGFGRDGFGRFAVLRAILPGLLGAAAVIGVVVTVFVTRNFDGPAEDFARNTPSGGESERSRFGGIPAVSQIGTPAGMPAADGGSSVGSLLEATGALRHDLHGMWVDAQGISTPKAHLKSEIEARIEICLADLVYVERRLVAFEE